jgi:hypothetical protein
MSSTVTPAGGEIGSFEMRDEIDSRLWVEHGSAFSEDLAKLFQQIGDAFARLTEIQYRAPWTNQRGCRS